MELGLQPSDVQRSACASASHRSVDRGSNNEVIQHDSPLGDCHESGGLDVSSSFYDNTLRSFGLWDI